ncbi:MAG: hypothetical protein JXA30_13235 [Deltaproteobacteria bacterium]|nr:hypothetical protein [Deltaproteobacteria bacterium]
MDQPTDDRKSNKEDIAVEAEQEAITESAPEPPLADQEQAPADSPSRAGDAVTAESTSTESEPPKAETAESQVSSEDTIGFGESDSDSVGFGEEDSSAGESAPAVASAGSLTLDSFVRSQAEWWSERLKDNPWAKLRQNLDSDLRYKKRFDIDADSLELRLVAGVHLEYDFAYLHQRDSYDDAVLDAYEYQIIGRETSLTLTYDVVELTFGRQIVAWGEGMVLSPIDVVNPQDFREHFLVDLVDRRMATLATKLGFYLGDHRLEAMVIHESYFGLTPPPMAAFSPLRALLLEDPRIEAVRYSKTLRYKDIPGRWVNQASQVLGRWSYAGHGFDLSFYAASILERRGVNPQTPVSEFIANDVVDIELWHPRYTMLAHSGSVPVEDVVLKWELAFDINRAFNTTDTSIEGFNVDIAKYHQLVSMFGFQYQNIVKDANLIFEYEQHYVIDSPEHDADSDSSIGLQFPVEQPQFALVWQQTFLQERLSLDIRAILFGIWRYTGWMAKAELGYELTEGLKAAVGYATFQPNDEFSLIYGMDSNDRILANLRWDFLLE